MKIHFEDVGRQKKTWTVELTEAELTEKRVLREIRKSGALLSQDIEFIIDGSQGRIYAGIRHVGRIRIEEDVAPITQANLDVEDGKAACRA